VRNIRTFIRLLRVPPRAHWGALLDGYPGHRERDQGVSGADASRGGQVSGSGSGAIRRSSSSCRVRANPATLSSGNGLTFGASTALICVVPRGSAYPSAPHEKEHSVAVATTGAVAGSTSTAGPGGGLGHLRPAGTRVPTGSSAHNGRAGECRQYRRRSDAQSAAAGHDRPGTPGRRPVRHAAACIAAGNVRAARAPPPAMRLPRDEFGHWFDRHARPALPAMPQ
jgi:hypothetical protein